MWAVSRSCYSDPIAADVKRVVNGYPRNSQALDSRKRVIDAQPRTASMLGLPSPDGKWAQAPPVTLELFHDA